MYVDADVLYEENLKATDTLKTMLMKQVFHNDPEVAQRIYNSLFWLLDMTMDQMARVRAVDVLEAPLVKQKHLTALSELLAHFGLTFIKDQLVLQPSLAKEVLVCYGELEGSDRLAAYDEGYLEGVADAYCVDVETLVNYARSKHLAYEKSPPGEN